MFDNQEMKESSNPPVPEITVVEDPQAEVEIFYMSLHNQDDPWMRRAIFDNPTLSPLKHLLDQDKIRTKKSEKQIIGGFLSQVRQTHQDKIAPFMELCQKRLDQSQQGALAALAELMDYQWPENFPGYKAIPTFLPFGPFGKNIYFYSRLAVTLAAIKGWKTADILDDGIHEVSHMMLFELLKKYHPEFSYKGPNQHPNYYQIDSQYVLAVGFLKEILAPVLMNQPPLRRWMNFGNYPEGYVGNNDLEQLYVREGEEGEAIQISRYFQGIYERMRYQEGRSFREIVDVMFNLLHPIRDELAQRNSMWNDHNFDIYDNEDLLKAYSQPIMIKP